MSELYRFSVAVCFPFSIVKGYVPSERRKFPSIVKAELVPTCCSQRAMLLNKPKEPPLICPWKLCFLFEMNLGCSVTI